MANSKTILSIEVYNKVYNVRYSGGVRPDWDHLSPKERKTVLRHDGRILDTLIACPPLFERLAGFGTSRKISVRSLYRIVSGETHPKQHGKKHVEQWHK